MAGPTDPIASCPADAIGPPPKTVTTSLDIATAKLDSQEKLAKRLEMNGKQDDWPKPLYFLPSDFAKVIFA